ncbi:MAG: hypothetical protein U0350_21410 [Caldilineaceae bacterium]
MLRNLMLTVGKSWVLVIVLGSVFGLNLAYWNRGDLLSLLVSEGIAAWEALLLAIAVLLANAFAVRQLARICTIASHAVLVGIFVSILLGYNLYLQDLNTVRLSRDPLIFSLEAYKNRHGHYPDKLSAVTLTPDEKPRLLDDTVLYYKDGERFMLSFFDPDPTVRFWIYDSVKKRWKITN